MASWKRKNEPIDMSTLKDQTSSALLRVTEDALQHPGMGVKLDCLREILETLLERDLCDIHLERDSKYFSSGGPRDVKSRTIVQAVNEAYIRALLDGVQALDKNEKQTQGELETSAIQGPS